MGFSDYFNLSFIFGLLLSILFIVMYYHFNNKFKEQEHKIATMFNIVSMVVEDVNGLKSRVVGGGGSPYLEENMKTINLNLNDPDYTELIEVSDDENDDVEEVEGSTEELNLIDDDDLDLEEVLENNDLVEDEDEDIEDEDEDEDIEDEYIEDDDEAEEKESMFGELDLYGMRDSDLDDTDDDATVNEAAEKNSSDMTTSAADMGVEEVHLHLGDEDKHIVRIEPTEINDINVEPALNPIKIFKVDLNATPNDIPAHEEEPAYVKDDDDFIVTATSLDYKKMSVQQLRQIVTEKGLHNNPQHLKKQELLKLLNV
jgi:hypothetical protein